MTGTGPGHRSCLTDSKRQLLTMPAWLQPVADINRARPAHVPHSLCIALGGWLLPISRQSRLTRWLCVAGAVCNGALILSCLPEQRVAGDILPMCSADLNC